MSNKRLFTGIEVEIKQFNKMACVLLYDRMEKLHGLNVQYGHCTSTVAFISNQHNWNCRR